MKYFIKNHSNLQALRSEHGLGYLEIIISNRLRGYQYLYAVRYAVWAVAPGAEVVVDAGLLPKSMIMVANQLPFQLFLQVVFLAIRDLGQVCHIDSDKGIVRLVRTKEDVLDTWAAGVIFSGNFSEVPLVRRCVESLLEQPELGRASDIAICGPCDGKSFFSDIPNVRYLPYDSEYVFGRFLVGRKKNFLVNSLRGNKILICHARIQLDSGALSRLPKRFDVVTPRVELDFEGIRLPYLDLGFLRVQHGALIMDGLQPPVYYKRRYWLDFVGKYVPYIDGALFCICKDLFQRVPISNDLAWGEGEDVEWAMRLLAAGCCVELCNDATAVSNTNKLRMYSRRYLKLWYRGLLLVYRVIKLVFQRVRLL